MSTRSIGTGASVAALPGAEFGTEGAALVLDDVSKRFGGLVAVSGVSFILPVGGRLAVIGPNGAGKTTLFRVIAGEMRASGGTIALFGENVTTEGLLESNVHFGDVFRLGAARVQVTTPRVPCFAR